MNRVPLEFFCVLIIALLGPAAGELRGQDLTWQTIPGGRWAALPAPAAAKPGFTALAPEQTGITFTNLLDERQAAANRVLLNGAGVAVGDYDRDGWPDIFFCSLNGNNTLERNLGGWRFADVTAQAGLKHDGRFYRGAVFADVNSDGWLDLLICVLGGGVECFLNDGHGKFKDATPSAHLASEFGSASLALADVDGNGTLDLYVANNRKDDIRDRGQVNLQVVNGQMRVPPEFRGRLLVANGQVLEYGEPDQLYLNDGQGHFTPISWTGGRFRDEAGQPLTQPPLDWGLSVTFRDINEDGFPDLYVCNDFWTPDRLWLNDGKGRFRAFPPLAWRNMCASSMGIDFADVDRDGHLDFFVADMLSRDPRLRKRQKPAQTPLPPSPGTINDRPQIMRNTFYRNRGDGTFAELANYAGVAASEWSWSPVFLDVDLDGYEDLLITTGHPRDVQDLDASALIQSRQRSWKGFTNEVERQKAFTQELMEHMRLYPRLDTPIVAFRNRGQCRFEEVTAEWGTAQAGVHHAMACGDFDRDGDLDLVVNNLDGAAGLYRNNAGAPRVAVRLHGLPTNIQGIGARVRLLGGPVPVQSQEMIAGGHYMAGSETLLTFAAGHPTGELILEVTWRSARTSRLTGVQPNRLYELNEAEAGPTMTPQVPSPAAKPVLFKDVSSLLPHIHHEEPFDDFTRQPLLPRRLSQLGPGVSWFDLDGDGREDLIIGSGRGGRLAGYHNNGQGGFEPLSAEPWLHVVSRDETTILGWRNGDGAVRLLIGSASYEDAAATAPSVRQFDPTGKGDEAGFPAADASTGPLASADLDGDGDLDVFVGGRVIPGRYPEAASSRLFRQAGNRFQLDPANTKLLEKVGLVSGAVWSDLDGNGGPELILACEWGPLRIFRNEHGTLTAWDPPLTSGTNSAWKLHQWTGWWTGVTTGDLDGDGRLDIVAANWGLNSDAQASPEQPCQLYYGDLLDRNVVDLFETEWEAGAGTPILRRRLDSIGQGFPVLLDRFRSHRTFSEASLMEVLGPYQTRLRKVDATTLASTVFFNRGDHFEAVPLPAEAQWSPAFGVIVVDFDGDGNEDVFLSQNFFALPAETPRLDAGRGLLLLGDGTGKLTPCPGPESGIEVYGEQRGAAVSDFDADGRVDLVVTQNGAATKLFHNIGAKAGWRVELVGPAGNRSGVGAVLRLKFGDQFGPAREIHAGSGYWSQDGAIQVLSAAKKATHLEIRWPGGQTSLVSLPAESGTIKVSTTGEVSFR